MLIWGSCLAVSRWTLAIGVGRHRIPRDYDEAAKARLGEQRCSPLLCSILGRRRPETGTLDSAAADARQLLLRGTSQERLAPASFNPRHHLLVSRKVLC